MSVSINKAILVGKISDDLEIRDLPNGKQAANFSICTEEIWMDKATGHEKTSCQFHKVAIFNDRLIDLIRRKTGPGSIIMVEGQLESRKYMDSKQIERQSTDIVVRPFKGNITVFDPVNMNHAPGTQPIIESKPYIYDPDDMLSTF